MDKGERVVRDFRDQLNALRVGSMINTSLEDATTVTMSGNFDTVGGNGIVDELMAIKS